MTASSCLKTSFLTSMRSNTASITASAVADFRHGLDRGDQRQPLVHLRLRQRAALHRSLVVGLDAPHAAFQHLLGGVDQLHVGMPASTRLMAMPPPIVPAPTTAIVLISGRARSLGRPGMRATSRSAKNA